MGDIIGWAFNLVPSATLDFNREPTWSPDVYNAIVWDFSAYLDISVKIDWMIEIG